MMASRQIAWLLAGLLAAGSAFGASSPFEPVPDDENMLAAVSRATHSLDDDTDVPVSVVPQPSQVKAARLMTYFLSTYHYKKTPLTDELGATVLDRFIDSLDPSHSYFLASDVEAFERYKTELADDLKEADLAAPFAIFNIYLARLKDRVDYATKLLEDDFDFSRDESYQTDRSEAPWPESREAQNELWRKRVKNDVLGLRLAGKEPDKISETLRGRYEGLGKRMAQLDSEDVFQLFMNAYGGAIEPHTAYLSPRTSENFQIAMSLSLEGIGAVLQREDEYTEIRRIVTGGPADKDGRLKRGDRIVGVGQGDDEPIVDVVGWRLDDVVELIRGPKDSKVRLSVLPANAGLNGPTETVSITRNKVELEEQTAQQEVIEVESGGEQFRIGVIDLPTFYIDFAGRAKGDKEYRSTTRDVRKLLTQLEEENVDGVVIDLRGNGGGSLIEATELTGLFIDAGPVVQVKDAAGEVAVERDPNPGVVYDGPLAVMVDRFSASASEIFAGAIQDYGRGVIIGEPTYGKGTVQNLINLDKFNVGDDESALGQIKITTAQFFRVSGKSTQHRGVIPDIAWPMQVDRNDTGESANDNALPWTSIDAAKFDRVANLEPVMAKADARHLARVEGDEEFGELMDDIESYYESRKNRTVSLNEDKRRAEYEEMTGNDPEDQSDAGDGEARSAQGEALDRDLDRRLDGSGEDEDDAEGPDRDDVLLREGAHILADMIRFSDDPVMRSASTESESAKTSN